MGSPRYPENQSPFTAELVERYERFAQLREDFLLEYGYNTARAYWGDLEHLNDWCLERGLDILTLDDEDLAKYTGWMRRRKYTLNTIRRRRGTYRMLIRRMMPSTQTERVVSLPRDLEPERIKIPDIPANTRTGII